MEQQIIRRRRRIGEEEGEGEREEELNNFLTVIYYLPDSLWSEIFYRLPVKSIFKLKCVSKNWLSIISHPSFPPSYTNRKSRATQPPWALVYRIFCHVLHPRNCRRDPSLYVMADQPVFGSNGFTLEFLSAAAAGRDDRKTPNLVVAVSNGLLLTTATDISHDCYYICNPLTKQWTALPKPPRILLSVSLGFIVNPCDGSFQVVRVGGRKNSSTIPNFEIFSSKTRQWKEKSASSDLRVNEKGFFSRAVPCKQILHWMDIDKIVACDPLQGDSENDETIRCHLIDLPRNRVFHDIYRSEMIGVCQDNLHYFHVAIRIGNLNIWELRNYNGGAEGEWFLLHTIRFDEVNYAPSCIPRTLAFHPFDSDLVYLHIDTRTTGNIVSLNLRSRVVKNCITQKPSIITWWTVFAFVLPTWPTPVPRISPSPD